MSFATAMGTETGAGAARVAIYAGACEQKSSPTRTAVTLRTGCRRAGRALD
jgi:hypothetical protein